MTKGTYCFIDKKNSIPVYIGKDSNIGKNRRYNQHYYPSNYNQQQINRVLINNPDRYEYRVICEYQNLTDDELNYLEIKEIMKHKFLYDEKPKFNYTIGGDGTSGYTHTKETRQKISEANSDVPIPDERKINMSKSQNTSGYFRVHKQNCEKCTQGFYYKYQYYENGKRKAIVSVSLDKLEKKVKEKELKWEKV